MCLKNAIFVSSCSEDICLVKNGSNTYLGDDGSQELVIICDHILFSRKNKWPLDCFLSPKDAGPWRNPCDTDTGNECSVRGLTLLTHSDYTQGS